MSASPPSTVAPSQKRPLEEPSSPSGPGEQPDAKRQALDKVVKEGATESQAGAPPPEPVPATTTADDEAAKPEQTNDLAPAANGTKDGQGDTIVPDAPTATATNAAAVLDTQPIQSTSSTTNGRAGSQGASMHHQDETGWLHVRAIISSAEAATVIGKGGENVTLIRRMSGAKCTVSDYSRGAVERILTVSGLVDAVAKVRLLFLPSYKTSTNRTGFWPHHSHLEQRAS